MEIVPEYTPSQQVLARSHLDRHDQRLRYARERAELSLAAVESIVKHEAA